MPELIDIYERLYRRFGPQHWWPGESRFEVIVGAILTQQANWSNVERAIGNLRSEGLLNPKAIAALDIPTLQELIRPSGYYRQKAGYLFSFCRFLIETYGADLDALFSRELDELRPELLAQPGVGPETADSIMLYAGERASFVIDAYTVRICGRLGLGVEPGYDNLKEFFETGIPRDVQLYNEFHALLVRLGKERCIIGDPKCQDCPLLDICRFGRKTLKE
jgi:endonuclease-3 related protein